MKLYAQELFTALKTFGKITFSVCTAFPHCTTGQIYISFHLTAASKKLLAPCWGSPPSVSFDFKTTL